MNSDVAILIDSSLSPMMLARELDTIDKTGHIRIRFRGQPKQNIVNQKIYLAHLWKFVASAEIQSWSCEDHLLDITIGSLTYMTPPLKQPRGFKSTIMYVDRNLLQPCK